MLIKKLMGFIRYAVEYSCKKQIYILWQSWLC